MLLMKKRKKEIQKHARNQEKVELTIDYWINHYLSCTYLRRQELFIYLLRSCRQGIRRKIERPTRKVCPDLCDNSQILTRSGHACVLSKIANLEQNSKMLLGSRVVILILSQKSASSSRVRDQVALAENHSKLIFPVAVSDKISLDPAMQVQKNFCDNVPKKS